MSSMMKGYPQRWAARAVAGVSVARRVPNLEPRAAVNPDRPRRRGKGHLVTALRDLTHPHGTGHAREPATVAVPIPVTREPGIALGLRPLDDAEECAQRAAGFVGNRLRLLSRGRDGGAEGRRLARVVALEDGLRHADADRLPLIPGNAFQRHQCAVQARQLAAADAKLMRRRLSSLLLPAEPPR